jgi:hypothetical protein
MARVRRVGVLTIATYLLLGTCLTRCFAQTESGYDSLIQQGKAQLQAGGSAQALSSAEQAMKAEPSKWEAYALAGGALMNLKRYEDAADRFSKAIDLAPSAKQTGLRELRKQCVLAESGGPVPASATTGAVPSQMASTSQAEIVLWKSIEDSQHGSDFDAYLSQYPNGTFAVLAKQHLSDLKASERRRVEQQAQITALRPVETKLLGGTLVKRQNEVFIAIPTYGVYSIPFYMVLSDGQPSFLVQDSIKVGKAWRSGSLLIKQNQVVIFSDNAPKTVSSADVVFAGKGVGKPYEYGAITLQSRDKRNPLECMVLTESKYEGRISGFSNRLLQDWDGVLSQIVSAGIDLKTLPNYQEFNLEKEMQGYDRERYK